MQSRNQEQENTGDAGLNRSDPPAINLPKGGGAIRGIGEKFAANPVTGTGSLTIPIATSPGRSDLGRSFHFPMIPAQVTGRLAWAGTCRSRRSPERPTKAYLVISMPMNPTSLFFPARKIWCRFWLATPTGTEVALE